jgi:hypothetical protein
VALQQGKYVGQVIRRDLPPGKRQPFHYHDKGFIAVIGRAKAVLQYGRLRLTGFLAWFAWIAVHIACWCSSATATLSPRSGCGITWATARCQADYRPPPTRKRTRRAGACQGGYYRLKPGLIKAHV